MVHIRLKVLKICLTKKAAVDILEKTTVKNGNRYEIGLLWKNEETKLCCNRDLAVNRFKSKFKTK